MRKHSTLVRSASKYIVMMLLWLGGDLSATITFAPGSSQADIDTFNTNLASLQNDSGAMGASLVWAANSNSFNITIEFVSGSTPAAAVDFPFGSPTIRLNVQNPSFHYLDAGTYGSMIGYGEEPPSAVVTLAHELAHAITYGYASESSVSQYYENEVRSARNETLRPTYNGNGFTLNVLEWEDSTIITRRANAGGGFIVLEHGQMVSIYNSSGCVAVMGCELHVVDGNYLIALYPGEY